MQDIKTFVYFDLEATGLKSSGRPRVCEMSLIAVNVSDIKDLNESIMNILSGTVNENSSVQMENIYPRVLNKLTLCVYPMATIVPVVSSLTGLDNYNLTGQSKFDKNIGDLLHIFLSRLCPPVCFIAHNGNLYDYPLLRAELEKAGSTLGSEILCVDSYVGMKEIFQKRQHNSEETKKIEDTKADGSKLVRFEIKAVSDKVNAGEFEKEMLEESHENAESDIKSDTKKTLTSCMKRQHQVFKTSFAEYQAFKSSKLENETTPTRSKTLLYFKPTPRKIKQLSNFNALTFRKKLEFSNQRMPTSFSLINLHKHLLGCPPGKSHGAEADCLALLRITAVLGNEWLEWAQNNCTKFEEFGRMWSMS